MPRVWIHSPSSILNTALAHYLSKYGFEPQLEPEPAADAVVWNLCGRRSPFLPPPAMPTLALLCATHSEDLLELLRLGYRGYYRPDDPPEDIPKALRTIMAGEMWADPKLIAQALTPVSTPCFTPKESEVMSLLTQGLSNKEIAQRLGNTEGTVKSHVSSILEKVGAKNRLDLLARSSSHRPMS